MSGHSPCQQREFLMHGIVGTIVTVVAIVAIVAIVVVLRFMGVL